MYSWGRLIKYFPFLQLFRSIFKQHHLNHQVQKFPLTVLGDVSHVHFGLLTFIFTKSWKTVKVPEAWKKKSYDIPLFESLNAISQVIIDLVNLTSDMGKIVEWSI